MQQESKPIVSLWILTSLLSRFLKSESKAGIILMICTVVSLFLANSSFSEGYTHIWHIEIAGMSVEHIINDALMAVFFLLVGLEIERQIYIGELRQLRAAMLPIFAAIGGMLVPALVHYGFNGGTPYQSGFGIPMATDIAFALGVLLLLGDKVPVSLKIFLVALAIIDDLGAILIIAIFYSKGIAWAYLGAAAAIFVFLGILNRLKVYNLTPYLVLGAVAWYCMLHSGIHATITGVILAFVIPFGDGEDDSPSYILEHKLTGIVAFAILPLFALANTAIVIPDSWADQLFSSHSLGIMLGLMLGKPLGILLFSWLAIKLNWSVLPDGMNWSHVVGVGLLAGIGFTMSMFIAVLAFDSPELIISAKIAIMLGSLLSAVLGVFWLLFLNKAPVQNHV
ncbi:MAG: Na+/H+ antiporter NhaA [Agitococcus sp.]|jgi:NhaA family Na+:H+ antiporter|nr:Na+/H+ antiporter NhaA [Moraxellaceae bacterium]MBP9216714.1 Na+/H+ antiporter NhaA [Agitococcus sp.]MBK9186508.1 Na+/H+ antiporter NhaA [Moraxellaceae bacterium]MBL0229940.1 Na+/H+ antiporter NhaA [Moraxellaceae bacterium]MCC6373426.1 Na+/H+ antiporter NhaA [Moraxellaceae bacterium]